MTLAEALPTLSRQLAAGLSGVPKLQILSADDTEYPEAFKKQAADRGLLVAVGLESAALVSTAPVQTEANLVIGVFERRGANKLGPSALDLAIRIVQLLGQEDECHLPDFTLLPEGITSGEREDASVNTFYLSVSAATCEQ